MFSSFNFFDGFIHGFIIHYFFKIEIGFCCPGIMPHSGAMENVTYHLTYTLRGYNIINEENTPTGY